MGIKGISSRFCALAGSISLLIFAGTALAASVDTTKIQPKVANVPVPAVKAPTPVPVQSNPDVFVRPTGPTRTSTQAVKPKVNIKTPVQNVRPAANVKVPTQPRPQVAAPGSVKRPPPPTPPNMPRYQPGSMASHPEIPNPPNMPRYQPGYAANNP